MTNALEQTEDYKAFIIALKEKVQSAQIKAAIAVNHALIDLYWEIGKQIVEKQQLSRWGDNVIGQIAKDLTRELGGLKGFSRANLYRMKQFYRFYADQGEIVSQLVRQIPWGHNALIVNKIKEPETALWYVRETLEHGWARSVLQLQIDSRLHERQAGKQKISNFANRLPAPQSDLLRATLKDPYLFDFLSVGDAAHERALESALVDQITKFMLELGQGFAFVGKQYHLEVGGDDFYIDLLFYHLKLHCYVAIELKNGPFKPEYAGKLNFYLTALDEQVKTADDKPSIGIILCKDKNNIVAEYALRGMSQPIGVSEYQLAQAITEELQKGLSTIETVEAEIKKAEEN